MIKIIDNFLNKITMYKIVLYSLVVLFFYSVILSAFHVLPFSPYGVAFSGFFIVTVSLMFNRLFAYIYDAPTNSESVYITALILFLLISPVTVDTSTEFFILAFMASLFSMASKYILAIKKKHIFNPVAIAVVLTALVLNHSASWWVATLWMMPVVIISGLLITRKTQRFDLVLSFMAVVLSVIVFRDLTSSSSATLASSLYRAFVSSSMLFFAFFMLTEPLTMPPTRMLRITYGAIVGFLFSPMVHIGPLYSTPEIALVIGNMFSYIVSPKTKLMLAIDSVSEVARGTYNFYFKKDKKLDFLPGQYMEFTLADDMADSRGNRRYFTLASSPTEEDIILGIKYYPNASSFKLKLAATDDYDHVVASQLSGEFVMPKDPKKKLVFIAGGIGVTPFRSMIKYLIDTQEKRDIVMFYSNKTKDDIAYRDVFDQAKRELGIRTIYTLTEAGQFATRADMVNRPLDAKLISQNVPDLKERIYYISGPNSMVNAFRGVLIGLGVPRSQIKVDFFPGFA